MASDAEYAQKKRSGEREGRPERYWASKDSEKQDDQENLEEQEGQTVVDSTFGDYDYDTSQPQDGGQREKAARPLPSWASHSSLLYSSS